MLRRKLTLLRAIVQRPDGTENRLSSVDTIASFMAREASAGNVVTRVRIEIRSDTPHVARLYWLDGSRGEVWANNGAALLRWALSVRGRER